MAMKILLYTISKSMPMTPLEWHYQKLCQTFNASVCVESIFNTDIDSAHKVAHKHNKSQKWQNQKLKRAQNSQQNKSASLAQAAYTKAFSPLLGTKADSIALHPRGMKLDSIQFSRLVDSVRQSKADLRFFIAGPYGFDDEFISKTSAISLSDLTFSHKIVRVVLLEQIYRALSIIHHHPYHK